MNLTTATPVEIDTALAAIYVDIYTARFESYRAADALADAEQRVADAAAGRRVSCTYRPSQIDDMRARAAAAHDKVVEQTDRTVPYDAEFDRRGGWTRAFLVVTSGKGHIHRSMTCSTCYPTTEFAWLPDMSGSDEATIVTAAGADACTVCYPSAPVETAGPRTVFSAAEKVDAATKAARDADRAEKRAAKAAKAIVDVDGSPLRGRWGVIATEVTAQREYVDGAAEAQTMVSWARDADHRAHLTTLAAEYVTAADRILAALAAKRGTTVEAQRETLAPKVTKKVREYA